MIVVVLPDEDSRIVRIHIVVVFPVPFGPRNP
jgi:hypothetical protein